MAIVWLHQNMVLLESLPFHLFHTVLKKKNFSNILNQHFQYEKPVDHVKYCHVKQTLPQENVLASHPSLSYSAGIFS